MNTANRGEIWMINLNPAKGREQSGIRPALIISDDFFNNSAAELVIVLPITSKKKGIPLHVQLSSKETGLKVESFVKCEDVRSISKERLMSYVGSISPATLEEVEYKIKLLLGL
ncbi:MAG: type II toxin-antitoxin system PemK/MazF family toxin [Bacteroidetes bacterium]|nr:type II toxin-antitoxin system PemK/MazF family toxin [Bacteroidota bacterium]